VIYVACPAAATAEKRGEARARAAQIAAEAKDANDPAEFAKVVARYSDDQATRYRAGDTGWLSGEGAGPAPEVRDALLSLSEPAEFAPLIETPRGFWIVKLTERREVGRQPLAQVKELITHELSRQKSEQAEREFYSRMSQGLEVRVNQALIDSITIPPEKLLPPKTPGGQTAKL
jgi:parvulin-like peptidyl-prolyl isomerase